METDPLTLFYEDDEMVSIATGTDKPVHLAPSVATVITADEIKAMGATHLDEVLETVVGLHVGRSYFNRMMQVYTIRGIYTANNPQILITFDGIPLKNLYDGSRLWRMHFPVANIARIEIIRGPGSAVHGADAFSGVINVVTKKADESKGALVGARSGSFDSQDTWLQWGHKGEHWDRWLHLDYSRSDGDPGRKVASDAATPLGVSYAPDLPLQTRYENFGSNVGMSNRDWRIILSSWHVRDEGVGPGAAQAIDPLGRDAADVVQLDLQYQWPLSPGGWQVTNRFYHQYIHLDTKFQILPPGSVVPIGDDGNVASTPNPNCPNLGDVNGDGVDDVWCLVQFSDGMFGNPGSRHRISKFEFTAIYDKHVDHLVRINFGGGREKLEVYESDNFGPGTPAEQVGDDPAVAFPVWAVIDGSLSYPSDKALLYVRPEARTSWFGSLQDEWQLARDWEFTGGVRYDHYSDFGGTLNPRAALVWATDYNLTSKLLLGSAFRAPTFSELHAQNNPVQQGNSNLDPETIRTAELVFDYRPAFDIRHLLTTYYYEAKDLIDFAPLASGEGRRAENLNEQTGWGVEWEAQWKVSQTLSLSANYAWQHAEDTKTGEDVPYAPGRQLTATILYKVSPHWVWYGSANRVANRQRAADDPRPQIKDYTWVNTSVRYSWSNGLEAAFGVRNLFDVDAREPTAYNPAGYIEGDYPLESRSVYVEAEYHM